jgi:hypothetical protein
MLFGALIVYGELKRAGRRWREAKRTWSWWNFGACITKLPRHHAPDMVAAFVRG